MYIKVLIISIFASLLVLPVAVSANIDVDIVSDFWDEPAPEILATFKTTARVNLRQGPDAESGQLAMADANSVVEVLDFNDGVWFRVSYNRQLGYMYAQFLVEYTPEIITTFITTASVNLRPTPSTDGERIVLVGAGRTVEVIDFRDGAWFAVEYNGRTGYMSADFLRERPQPGAAGHVEKLDWSTMRNIIPKNTPFTVIDVRSGLSYQMISFSHGNHADVFPATAADTEIFRQSFGGRWDWQPRPVVVLVGGRTVAASINGMPHGGGSSTNNMNGHVCLHFLGSRTHNGNRSHERDHQNAVAEAFNTASRW